MGGAGVSLINKMLQDLDARGSQDGAPAPSEVRPVPKSEWKLPLPVLLVSAISAVSLAAGGYFALRFYEQRQAARPAAPVVQAAPPVAPPPAPVETPEPAPAPEPSAPPPPRAEPKLAGKSVAKPEKKAAPVKPAAAARPSAAAKASPDFRGSAQAAYRRALAMLEEGRVTDSMVTLEQALRLDPRHDGARQTLVRLLIEDKRTDEAMRQLQAGLAVDANQPAMAMLLARLQIERGGNGIDTLMRTLSAAAGKPDYHAFLAGALARVQRHREAAEQYQAALRAAPNNGVWLMGLGIALQGDGRDAEALAAYQRARAVGTLSPELQSFVERKINQLAR